MSFNFCFLFFALGSLDVAQAVLELVKSSDPPTQSSELWGPQAALVPGFEIFNKRLNFLNKRLS